MSDEEEYEYEYEYDDDADDDMEEENQFEYDAAVALENAYYKAKGLRETDNAAAAKALEEVIQLEQEELKKTDSTYKNGLWSYRAMKQLTKLHLRAGDVSAIEKDYNRLLECISTGDISPNQIEKGINGMLERVASLYNNAPADQKTNQQSLLAVKIYDSTLLVFHPVTGTCKNERLWFKTNLKYGQLLYEMNETAKLQTVLKDLQSFLQQEHNNSANGGDTDMMNTSSSTSSTQSMEIDEAPPNASVVGMILLPGPGYKLYCWKVRNGSSVRKGETIALAMPKDDEQPPRSQAAPSTSGKAAQHKRPTKRRRPNATANPSGSENLNKKVPAVAKPARVSTSLADNRIPILAPADGLVCMGTSDLNLNKTDGVSALAIGYLRTCLHPTIIDGLCAICGKPASAKQQATSISTVAQQQQGESSSWALINSMSRVTVSGLTVAVSEEEGRRMAQQDAERLRKQRKLSLVLDLDHTLVHATADTRARKHLSRDDVRSLILNVMGPGSQIPGQPRCSVWMHHYIKLRPHVKEFLETVQGMYEIGVYTAGTREYADQITILLSRHLVGATRDHNDLEQLRYRVAQAEAEVKRIEEDEQAKPESASKDDNSTTNGTKNDSTTDSKIGEKRKRVTFGEVPSSTKTDQTTLQKLEELRAELVEADRLEKQALELRQRLFGSRVVSRTDVGDLGRDVKSLKRIFPCGGTMAAVVDDREDVWANAGDIQSARKGEPPENLLLIRPYHWNPFVGFADVNNPAGVDLSAETLQDDASLGENDTDEQLLWTTDILKRLHEHYYSYPEGPNRPTVPEILRMMRHQVLAGSKIVLSGLVPLHKQNLGTHIVRPPIVRYVESLGAPLLPTVVGSTTHVVAAKDGTDKILAARKVRRCQVVKASWLMECLWSLTHRDEQPHLLGPKRRDGAKSKGEESSSSSDESDDLPAALKKAMMEESASK